MKTFLIENIDTIIVAAAGVGAWMKERHSRRKDQVDLTKDIVGMYRSALEDFKKQYDIEISSIRNDLAHWKERYAEMEGKYNTLRKAFEDYKRKHK